MSEKFDKAQIVLDQRQASRVVALLIIAAAFIFIAGYYLGKMSSADDVVECLEREAFADRVHSSLYASCPCPDASPTSKEQTP